MGDGAEGGGCGGCGLRGRIETTLEYSGAGVVRCLWSWLDAGLKPGAYIPLHGGPARGRLPGRAKARPYIYCPSFHRGFGEVLGGLLGGGVDFYQAIDFGHF